MWLARPKFAGSYPGPLVVADDAPRSARTAVVEQRLYEILTSPRYGRPINATANEKTLAGDMSLADMATAVAANMSAALVGNLAASALANASAATAVSAAAAASAVRAATRPSIVALHSPHDRVKARLRMLRQLSANHDGEGALAPNSGSIDRAIAFVDRITDGPQFNATLDDDGSAVIEFEDRSSGFFADITFSGGADVEMYKRERSTPSEFYEGRMDTPEARAFMELKIGVVL